ncbi:hypothetical protein RHMOL_Rhmol01G0210300 [Rhododendron molle]|uniref:Uncharacterized protein n=1 Tax=Rhododendron molle TaxID=49168 RepID=A0ACC0Q6W4_RHOML|nr:hypothetical protein RHMOL_Rhmol01G0210300 [Rhododendron molle]
MFILVVLLGTTKNCHANSTLISQLIKDDVRDKSKKRHVDVVDDLKEYYGVDVSYNRAWLAVKKAKSSAFGDYSDSFNQLQWYRNVVLNSDPRRFKHHRPVISVDATFLKARHMGCLMSALAKDGNAGLFPLCFGLVNYENNDIWLWFMEKLHGNLHTALASINVKYKESLIRVFSKCAYALTVAKFNQHMERELPVVDMVDRMRKKMMKSLCLRRERASKWEQVICPYGESRLEKLYDLVKTWKMIHLSVDIFEVDTDLSVYSKSVYPVASLWKGDVVDCGTSILPPLSKKLPGRPKKKRIRSNGEKVREMKCGRCGKMGNHNKFTCKEDLWPGF